MKLFFTFVPRKIMYILKMFVSIFQGIPLSTLKAIGEALKVNNTVIKMSLANTNTTDRVVNVR